MNIITIDKLNFKYKNKVIFENLNLKIKEKSITTILGKNGCGKSTLIKLLVGLYPNNDSIMYKDKVLNKTNLREIMKKVGVVFEIPDNQFIGQTVKEDLVFTLENMGYEKLDIEKRLNDIVEMFDLYNILNESPNNLSNNEKQMVSLAAALIHEPEILILDESLTYVDPYVKDKIFDILIKLNKKGLTIIYVTQDIEDTLIADRIILLDNKKVILSKNKDSFYKEEKKLNDLGYKLPFMVELSNRLKFYNLIDETIYDMKKMVDTLWK